MKSFGSLLVILALVSAAHGQLFTNLTVVPTVIKNGFTRTAAIDIECSVADTGTAFDSVTYLAIAKLDLVYSVEVTATNGSTTATIVNPNARWSAVAELDGSDFLTSLTLTITNPVEEESGRYLCIAQLFAGTTVRPTYVDVDFEDIDVDLLVETLQGYEEDIANLTDRLDNLPVPVTPVDFQPQIDTLSGQLSNLTSQLDDNTDLLSAVNASVAQVDCLVDYTRENVERLDADLYRNLGVHFSSDYYVSMYTPQSFRQAEQACARRGGHVAEINTLSEFEFIEFGLHRLISVQQQILIGLRRNGTTGEFFQSSGEGDVFEAFYGSALAENNTFLCQDCVVLSLNKEGESGLLMDTVHCDWLLANQYINLVHGFLCETPLPGLVCGEFP